MTSVNPSAGHSMHATPLMSHYAPAIQFKVPQTVTGTDMNAFALEAFINNLDLQRFSRLDPERKLEFLEHVDALDLYYALMEINRTLSNVKLENHYLTDFLEKNEPKMLIGLKQRRATASIHKRLTITSGVSDNRSSGPLLMRRSSSRRSMTTITQSIYTAASSTKRSGAADYRLNYRAKADMAEKCANDVEKRIRELELRGMREIKMLTARIEELQLRCNETRETADNFDLHFRRDERDLHFLDTATERQIERKFRKFVNNWFKNARSLLSTMRLRITALQESSQQYRSDLITKADLSGILSAVDFEQLIIKRTMLMTSLDDKNQHMSGLKAITGKAALAMSEEKQQMMATEEESKRISSKTIEVIRTMSKLDKESKMVEESNMKDMKTLNQLKDQLERYEAPSVSTYIKKKDELLALEKEYKMLTRKVHITQMKLKNVQKQCKLQSQFH